jgi:hypothetical protein
MVTGRGSRLAAGFFGTGGRQDRQKVLIVADFVEISRQTVEDYKEEVSPDVNASRCQSSFASRGAGWQTRLFLLNGSRSRPLH